MFEVDRIGGDETGTSYDIRTRGGCFAGIISVKNDGTARVYFNSTATRGSTRKFMGLAGAINYIYDRRVKKGWKI